VTQHSRTTAGSSIDEGDVCNWTPRVVLAGGGGTDAANGMLERKLASQLGPETSGGNGGRARKPAGAALVAPAACRR